MNTPLSVYVHWPFCKAKCPYCDFNSHVRDKIEHTRWRAALLRELGYYARKLPGRKVVSVFFGGGTPSLMEPETVKALIEGIAAHWHVSNDIEITLEANPTSIEAGKFREFRRAGINRVSVGIQALRQPDLEFLGRQHSVPEALDALQIARDTFPRYTFDLIYARPGQTLAAWEAELRQALKYADGHLSLYQLTIEENTAFHTAHEKGVFQMPQDDLAADMYRLTQAIMQAHGLPAYEVSNHARAGEESRHNLAYWRGDDYVGIGPGAHGRYSSSPHRGEGRWGACCGKIEPASPHPNPPPAGEGIIRFATENIKSPERWLEKVEQVGHGLAAETVLSDAQRTEEAAMMGLRLAGGIHYADWQARTGLNLRDAFNPAMVSRFAEEGFIDASETRIRVTAKGRLLLNRVTAELLAN